MRDVHFDVWFRYLSLVFFRLGPVEALENILAKP